MERVKLDNRRILFNLLPAHVAQHFLLSNPRNMVSRPPALSPEAEGPLVGAGPSEVPPSGPPTSCPLTVSPRSGSPLPAPRAGRGWPSGGSWGGRGSRKCPPLVLGESTVPVSREEGRGLRGRCERRGLVTTSCGLGSRTLG